MDYKKIASLVAEREGKKSETHIGNIREILKVLIDLEFEYAKMGASGPLTVMQERVGKMLDKWKAKLK